MLKQLKLGLSLIQYGFKFKYSLISVIIISIIGGIIEFFSGGTNMVGAFYLEIAGMTTYQLNVSVTISDAVQVSPLKKPLQTTVPVITSSALYFVIFTLLLIEKALLIQFHPEDTQAITVNFVVSILMVFFSMMFCACCYKFYGISFTIFILIACTSSAFATIFSDAIYASPICSGGIASLAIFGYLVIFVGIFAEYALSCALYKYPLSQFAFKGFSDKLK